MVRCPDGKNYHAFDKIYFQVMESSVKLNILSLQLIEMVFKVFPTEGPRVFEPLLPQFFRALIGGQVWYISHYIFPFPL